MNAAAKTSPPDRSTAASWRCSSTCVSKGFKLTITSLKCGHSIMSSSGYVSEHSTGDAVDIAVIDGVPVTGHQGPGTLVPTN